MGIISDSGLLPQAQPSLFGVVNAEVTEGGSWVFPFVECVDASGTPINMSALTGTCRIFTRPGGSVVATLTYTGGVGTFTLSLAPGSTAGLAGAGRKRRLSWGMYVEDGADRMTLWAPAESNITVLSED